jgi:hypothetical protein
VVRRNTKGKNVRQQTKQKKRTLTGSNAFLMRWRDGERHRKREGICVSFSPRAPLNSLSDCKRSSLLPKKGKWENKTKNNTHKKGRGALSASVNAFPFRS